MEPIKVTKEGRIRYGIFECKICNTEYKISITKEKRRLIRRSTTSPQGHVCGECLKRHNHERIAKLGTEKLKGFTAEEKSLYSSLGGKAQACSHNSGRFTTERWNSLTEEEQHKKVKRASDALQEKLKDPEYREEHFRKVFQNSRIGYISKGHKDLHQKIKEYGFNTHVNVGGMEVDECSEEYKLVVEYHGDFWHCNPRMWNSEDYNNAIKMTAGQKWQKDIARNKRLAKLGYEVIIVWESEWIKNPEKYLNRIRNEIEKQNKN